MSEAAPPVRPKARAPLGFRIIGILKFGSGLLLFAAWFGMFKLFKSDVAGQIDWLARHLKLDPENHLFLLATDWISGLDRKKLRAIEAGTFFYALLHVVEGTGLILERYWAGYLTVVATSALVPYEIYEIFHKPNALKLLVLVVNLGFVAYVVVKLREELRIVANARVRWSLLRRLKLESPAPSMILCVTLNPCLDKTLAVPAWRPGESVRGRAVGEVVGGKGNNVARALARLGRMARPVTFFGGAVGQRCQELLQERDRLEPLVIATGAATREILTVRTEGGAEQTAFFDPDPEVAPAESEALFRTVEAALGVGEVTAVTLSGSSPAAATHGLFSDLVGLVRSRRVPVLLDTYGPALAAIWGFWPDAMQVNRREAAIHLGTTAAALTDSQLFAMLEGWCRRGVRSAVVTDGPRPVLAVLDGRRYRALPPAIAAVNPVGSGDCLLAGTTDGWLAGLTLEPALRRGIACAVSNALVWEAGSIDPDEMRRQEEAVVIEPA